MDPAVFEPAARSIYQFADGSGQRRCADPLALRGKIAQAAIEVGAGTVDSLIDAANKGDMQGASDIEVNEAWMALSNLEAISRKAFGLVDFDPATGAGADMAHAIGVLNHFHLFLQKKNQMPVTPSISTPPVESISEIQQTTGMSSASS